MAQDEPRFHVPAPHVRPGDTPDFSHLDLQAAGEAPRPDPSVAGMETRDLALGLIGVLDHNHQAVGDWDPKLQPDVLREGLRHMMLTRAYDDRMLKLQRQGKMSFYMKSTGEEAVAQEGGEDGGEGGGVKDGACTWKQSVSPAGSRSGSTDRRCSNDSPSRV